MFDAAPVDPPPGTVVLSPPAAVAAVPTPSEPRAVLTPFAALLGQLAADADARFAARAEGRQIGPVTSLPELDQALGGALAPGLHVLHGSPGSGKTAFALQVGTSCGCPCLFVTAEMSPLELLRRHTARVSGTFLGKFKDGTLTANQALGYAQNAAAAAPLFGVLDATAAPATLAEVFTAAEITREQGVKAGGPGHLLIVVDSLHSWADGLGQNDVAEYDRLNEALAGLRMLAKRLECPVLTVAERNRGGMKDHGQHSGAGTRKIEYGAETVIGLQTEPDAQPDTNGELDVTLRISKNRNGGAGGAFPLRFHGATQRFRLEAVW